MKNFERQGRAGKAEPMRAIIYCRVGSTTAGDSDPALLFQEMRCRAYAAEKGYPVATVIHDCPASGALLDRAGIRQVFQYLARENAPGRHVVIVDDVNRLARSAALYLDLREALAAAGAKLECRITGIGSESAERCRDAVQAMQRTRGPKR